MLGRIKSAMPMIRAAKALLVAGDDDAGLAAGLLHQARMEALAYLLHSLEGAHYQAIAEVVDPVLVGGGDVWQGQVACGWALGWPEVPGDLREEIRTLLPDGWVNP